MIYSYDRRRSRDYATKVVNDLVRFTQLKDRAWLILAYDQADFGSHAAEYILSAFGGGYYELASRGSKAIIPMTRDPKKLQRYLGSYVQLDWEPHPFKPRAKPKSFWESLF